MSLQAKGGVAFRVLRLAPPVLLALGVVLVSWLHALNDLGREARRLADEMALHVQQDTSGLVEPAGGRLRAPEGFSLVLLRPDGTAPGPGEGGPPALLEALARGEPAGLLRPLPWEVIAWRRVEGRHLVIAQAGRRALSEAWARVLPWHLALGMPASLALLWLGLGRREAPASGPSAPGPQAEALVESEARLRRVQRIGRVGGFEIDLRSGVNARSAEYMAVQGLPDRAASEQHQDWVRRLHPEDRERAERHFLAAIADGAPHAEYAQEYRIVTPEGEVRWISARAEIERGADGRAVRMVGAHVDVTELKRAQAALAASEQSLRLAQEAALVGTWEWDPDTGRGAWSHHQFALFGLDPTKGTPPGYEAFLQLVHPEDREAVRGAATEARRTGLYQVEFRIRRGPQREVRWLIGRGRRMPGPDGAPGRILGVNVDITERKLAEERNTLLAREVDHRAKNALAVVQAALRLTRGDSVPDYRRSIEGRIAALARAHSLLSAEGWRGAELRSLAEGEVAPFTGGGEGAPRVELDGPALILPAGAVQPISMALHELATNAMKYGALGTPGGVVLISWTLQAEGRALSLRWAERGGPPVQAPPERRGFGSRVLQGTIADQLGGELTRRWEPDGLVVDITVPLDRPAVPEAQLHA